MNPIDFESLRTHLLRSDDKEVIKTVRLFDEVFRKSTLRPRAPFSSLDPELVDRVCAAFPTPFARKVFFLANAFRALPAAYDAWKSSGDDPLDREMLAAQVSSGFLAVFQGIWDCWLQIVRFLPFILIAMLARIDNETLRRYAAHQLAKALFHYKTFYGKIDDSRHREADQLHLLRFLLGVFRHLSDEGYLSEDFFLEPLQTASSDGFNGLFPDRFDACMRIIQGVRNRVVHGEIQNRSPDLIEPIIRLFCACFCDVLGTLLPLCDAYSINYVIELEVEKGRIRAAALDFSGARGPRETHFDVIAEPQARDEYAFRELQLYLIARQRETGAAGEAASRPLTHKDYLNLTPFLISERLIAKNDYRQQMLFVLQQYLGPSDDLQFLELGSAAQQRLPPNSGKPQVRELVDKLESFRVRANELTEEIRADTGPRVNIAQARALLWSVSRHDLNLVVQASLYDEFGMRLAGAARCQERLAYDADLFVEPANGEQVSAFLGSDRRGLMVVGDSGYGKSNLLVNHYLERLRKHELAVFLSGRKFDTPQFRDTLAARVAKRVLGDGATLADLNLFLDEHSQSLLIFVDAVNEYSGPQGPLGLLDDIIDTIVAEAGLRRCKVIASCRSETWRRYAEQNRHTEILDPAVFHLEQGGPLWIRGFESEDLRRALYARYQQHYRLRPASFDALPASLRGLIAQPFLMALVAQAYANDPAAEPATPVEIPENLDYYALFDRLTKRKKENAEDLVPRDEAPFRRQVQQSLETFCERLAELIYAQLTDTGQKTVDAASRDAVSADEVDKKPKLQPFVRRKGGTCILDLALDVGMILRTDRQQRDPNGKQVVGTAYRFFHDQYTQYWLSSAYQQRVLNPLDDAALGDAAHLDGLIGTMASIAEKAVDAPVLTGAFDHWLQRNLINFHNGKLAPVVPLFNRMAAHESAMLQGQLVSMLTMLILRSTLSAQQVYEPVFRDGSKMLRLRVVQAFAEYWPELPPSAARALIDACDAERDSEALERLADVFTVHLLENPADVIAYLDDVVDKLRPGSLLEAASVRRQLQFMLQFTVFSLMASFDRADRVEALRELFRAKYAAVVDMLIGAEHGLSPAAIARSAIRAFIYKRAESFGVSQWHQFIGYMEESGNQDFYVCRDGIVQQDVLLEFLPYAVDLHNGRFERLSLDQGSSFHTLMLRMLDYRVMSIIGYNAVLALPGVLLRYDWSVTEDFVMSLIERRTPAVLFFGNLLLLNLSYSNPDKAQPCLTLMQQRIVPLLLRERLACDWSIIFCIASLDVDTLWPTFELILGQLLDHVGQQDDPAACAAFGDILYKACYCPEITLGRRVIEFLFASRPRFLAPLWRACTLKVLAAMLTRSPPTLRALCAAHGVGDSVVREARAFQSEELVKQSRLFPMQVDVNRFTAWVYVGEPRMRDAVIKYFIGSLATGDSIEDFAKGVRETVVTLIKVFFGDAGKQAQTVSAGMLTVDEIVASTRKSRGRRRDRNGTGGTGGMSETNE